MKQDICMTRSASLGPSLIRSVRMIAAVSLLALAGCSTFGGGGDDEPDTPTVGNRIPILSRIAAEIAPDPLLANVAVVLPTAETNADWPQSGRNAAKVTGHVTLSDTPTRAWSVQIAGATASRRLAACFFR